MQKNTKIYAYFLLFQTCDQKNNFWFDPLIWCDPSTYNKE